jgi:hypothetical protein
MANENLHNTRWLRSRPTQGGFTADKIDAEAGIIRDVVMVQEGPAKGHGVHLESEFIDSIVEYDQKVFSNRGLKARFGHPSASSETMGTQLGIFKNFRKRTENGLSESIADLHLLEAANESPTHPGMRNWVLKMAQENPEFIMSSIVFEASGYYQRNPNGEKHPLELNHDFDGGDFTNFREEYGNIFVEFHQHLYTDLVEAGAATESLFSNQVNPHLFVAQADQFLYDHPELKKFIQSNPDKVTAFFGSLGIQLTGSAIEPKPKPKTMAFNLFTWLSGETPAEAEDIETIRTELTTAQTSVMELKAEKLTAENRVAELKQGNDALQSALGEMETQLSKATERIAELEAKPAALHTGGPTEASISSPEKGQRTNEVYQRYGIK